MGEERREGGREEGEVEGQQTCDSMSAGSSAGLGRAHRKQRAWGRGLSPNCLPGRGDGVITSRRSQPAFTRRKENRHTVFGS